MTETRQPRFIVLRKILPAQCLVTVVTGLALFHSHVATDNRIAHEHATEEPTFEHQAPADDDAEITNTAPISSDPPATSIPVEPPQSATESPSIDEDIEPYEATVEDFAEYESPDVVEVQLPEKTQGGVKDVDPDSFHDGLHAFTCWVYQQHDGNPNWNDDNIRFYVEGTIEKRGDLLAGTMNYQYALNEDGRRFAFPLRIAIEGTVDGDQIMTRSVRVIYLPPGTWFQLGGVLRATRVGNTIRGEWTSPTGACGTTVLTLQ